MGPGIFGVLSIVSTCIGFIMVLRLYLLVDILNILQSIIFTMLKSDDAVKWLPGTHFRGVDFSLPTFAGLFAKN